MTFDPLFCFFAGLLSCLTPEALLLLPLLLGASAASGRVVPVMTAAGLGLALAATGAVAVWLGAAWGFEAVWVRRAACLVLLALGIVLLRRDTVARMAILTGGTGGPFAAAVPPWPGPAARHFLLAALVGASWLPRLGPLLGKATLMAADALNARLALGMLFAFGAGAAVPWLIMGRGVRAVVRPFAEGVLTGMAGKRLLGLTLLAVAIAGLTGLDVTLAHWVDGATPLSIRRLALVF